VFESDRALRHLAFFEELAALDESDAEWRSVTAGLVVLRLMDAWMEDGRDAVTADAWGLRGVRAAIEEVHEGSPLRAVLGSVVDAMEECAVTDMSAVAPRLLAYGRALEYEARYALASDVYRAVIAHTHPVEEGDIATAAHLQLAMCLRISGNLVAASEAYSVAGDIAQATDDMVGVLRARIGDARIAIQRGNLPKAEQLLDKAIDDSSRHNLEDVRSAALHERAGVAFFRGDYERSIQFAYEAMTTAPSARDRDRMLNDIATAFMRLGVLTAARDAYLVLTVTAQEQFTRWNATINLMEIGARTGSEPLFERYRRELADVSLPPLLTVDYHIQAAEGYQLLGRSELACGHLERALRVASEHHLNQVVFYVEEALERVSAPTAPPRPFEPQSSSDEVQQIAGAIRRMREGAGTPG
jgi:tetratricopeptide (TPR) repeat protein